MLEIEGLMREVEGRSLLRGTRRDGSYSDHERGREGAYCEGE